MILYLDTEFNSFGGDLISLALVPQEDMAPEFYQALECPNPHPWVAENVIPILNIEPISLPLLRLLLERYLAHWSHVHIVADWPEDIAYFCKALITGPGTRIKLPKLTFEIVHVDAPSKIPHNALEDARGIRNEVRPLPPL